MFNQLRIRKASRELYESIQCCDIDSEPLASALDALPTSLTGEQLKHTASLVPCLPASIETFAIKSGATSRSSSIEVPRLDATDLCYLTAAALRGYQHGILRMVEELGHAGLIFIRESYPGPGRRRTYLATGVQAVFRRRGEFIEYARTPCIYSADYGWELANTKGRVQTMSSNLEHSTDYVDKAFLRAAEFARELDDQAIPHLS